MNRFTKVYKDLVYEKLEDKVQKKLTEKYKSLKRGILGLVEKSIKSEELLDAQNLIADYIENSESGKLVEFIEDNQIFDFYLKYQVDIDDLCNETKFFDEAPKKRNIFSLYSYVIEGTKHSVIECMKILQKEIF